VPYPVVPVPIVRFDTVTVARELSGTRAHAGFDREGVLAQTVGLGELS